MKETVIFTRHPRFQSWFASISKRLPLSEEQIRFAGNNDSLEENLAQADKLILVDHAWSDELEHLLPSSLAQVILLGDVQASTAPQVWQMRTLCMERPQIHAFVDFSRDPEFYLPVLRSALLARDGAGKMGEVRKLSEKLNVLVSQNLSELQRLKKLHEKLVPLRGEKIKGVNVHSKFAAGLSSGGEFFDTVDHEREILILLASSHSYIASSAILGHFEDLRGKNSFDEEALEAFVTALSYELKRIQTSDVELLLLTIDLNTMEVKGLNFGAATIWKNDSVVNKINELEINPNFVEKARVDFRLQRGERILIRSSGLAQNLEATEFKSNEKWTDFLNNMSKRNAHEIMGELFFQLKKDRKEDFLKTDASAILIEVDQNAILQV